MESESRIRGIESGPGECLRPTGADVALQLTCLPAQLGQIGVFGQLPPTSGGSGRVGTGVVMATSPLVPRGPQIEGKER